VSAFGWDDLRPFVPEAARVLGQRAATFSNVRPLDQADELSLVWLAPKRAKDAARLLGATRAAVVIAPDGAEVPEEVLARACVVLTTSPRLVFSRVVLALFARPGRAPGVHASATVDPGASVDPTAYVGPHCHVGRAVLGPGVVLDGHVHVYDGVRIGARSWIGAHAVLGVDGFGFTPDENGEHVHFPHLGGVELGVDVRVGAHGCVVRGTLGDTVVGDGTKLDNFVTVGHNARVGRHVLVASHAIVGGSSVVGDGAWVSPAAQILNGVKIGAGAVVGAGACVVADVPDQGKVVARPARLLPRALWRMRTPIA
jgi:UDP-3-O-[3-hydroxymyristoyl] glucosamine N-acyltransferase